MYTHVYMCVYIYIYIYMCICVHICRCVYIYIYIYRETPTKLRVVWQFVGRIRRVSTYLSALTSLRLSRTSDVS